MFQSQVFLLRQYDRCVFRFVSHVDNVVVRSFTRLVSGEYRGFSFAMTSLTRRSPCVSGAPHELLYLATDGSLFMRYVRFSVGIQR